MKPASIAAQGLGWIDEQTRAIVPPIHTSTTFIRDPDNQYRSGRSYARDQNPTFDQAEAVLTALEGGHASLLFASGMAAATAVFLALQPGDRVLAPKVMYWSLRNWLATFATQWGLRVTFIDMSDPEELRSALRAETTRLVWIETPANPLWTITDIALTSEIAHAAGAIVAVDSTVATPVLTRPLALGADIVMHSATKYLNGHSDVIAGTLTAREDTPLWQRIRSIRAQIGGVIGPFEAWLLLRGMRTLFPRVRAACDSAQAHRRAALRKTVTSPRSSIRACHPLRGMRLPRARCSGGFGGMLSRAGAGFRGRCDDRRARRDCDRRERETLETRHIARRRRKPDRAPVQRRRRGHAGARRLAASVSGPRRRRRSGVRTWSRRSPAHIPSSARTPGR